MRLPSYSDLSEEQDNVYLRAPLDGALLVSGPPGSGKTVMALYRADAIVKKGQRPTVLVYNNALKNFARSAVAQMSTLRRVNIETFHTWLGNWWWQQMRERTVPQVERFRPDWDAIVRKLMDRHLQLPALTATLGHLIVDEGQDFAPAFYSVMRILLSQAQAGRMSVAVFADENQRINPGQQSTLKTIAEALNVSSERRFTLKKNYRNTKQIAAVAATFFAGLEGGVPDPPDKNGPRPRVTKTLGPKQVLNHIERFVLANDDLETAVFVRTTKQRSELALGLRERLRRRGSPIRVQEVAGREGTGTLGRRSTVNVICAMSAKGLEFDAVFICHCESFYCESGHEQVTKMLFYVLSSRARRFLHFLHGGQNPDEVPVFRFLLKRPDLMEWSDGEN